MEYESLIVEKTGAVGTVRLNRPEKHNALNAQLSHELIAALDALEADDEVNVIVLTGAGEKAFCAGADMAEAVGGNGPDSSNVGAPAQAVARVLRTAKPIIAAVNGYAYGGGAVLAINCDIRIASENAKFRFVGASYGLVVGAFQLPGIVGAPLAKELIFTARTIDAQEALRIGLVNHLTPLEKLEPTVMEVALAIAANSRAAVMASKQVIDTATSNREALRQEVEANQGLRKSDEHRERFRAAAMRVTGEK
ncbi:MAG: enoyl-CoA hydratase/isomerase family protein [Dehalococcoidia bacterium]|nr:enoyl-CoA hydratase/isomerase family protein [Dehalococcoidia bacterium]